MSTVWILFPLGNNIIYADFNTKIAHSETVSDYVDKYNFKYISKLEDKEATKYKEALKTVLTANKNINKEQVIHLMEKYVAKSNNMLYIELRFWDGQGLTVDDVGGTIDGLIIALTSFTGYGGAKAALSAYLNANGKQKLIILILDILSKIGAQKLAPIVTTALNVMIQSTSPGKALTKWYDSIDFYPNNGRLNFWP